MANWNEPTTITNYLTVLSELKERDENLATMFSSGTSSNLIAGTIRWSISNSRFESWDGVSVWSELDADYDINVTSIGGVALSGLIQTNPGAAQTISTGNLTITNNLIAATGIFTGNVTVNDGNKFTAGNSQDLELYHDVSNNSLIRNNTGILYIDSVAAAGQIVLRVGASALSALVIQTNGESNFYANMSMIKAAPTLNLTSTAASDNKIIYFRSVGGLVESVIYDDGAAAQLRLVKYASDNSAWANSIIQAETGTIIFQTGGSPGVGAATHLSLAGYTGSMVATFQGGVTTNGAIAMPNSGSGGVFQAKKNNGVAQTIMQLFTDDKLYIDSPLDIRLRTNGFTDCLTLNASQNAIFAGTITSGAVNSNIKLNTWVYNIGTWNMTGTSAVVSLGIAIERIRSVNVLIRNDTITGVFNLEEVYNTVSSGSWRTGGTSITLYRSSQAGALFNGTAFDFMGGDGNRGWVTIQYID